MRLRTANCRRKRQSRTAAPKGEPFCCIVYGKRYIQPVYDKHDGFYRLLDYEVVHREWNRPFPNYVEAIAHLTRTKLAIEEEDAEWAPLTPCKIVEGVYTKSRKEKIIKITRLNDECNRPPERGFSSGLPREQLYHAQQLALRFGIPLLQALDIVRQPSWSSGSTTGSSTATTVDTRWNDPEGLSF